MRLDASILTRLTFVFSLSAYVVHIIILFHASLQHLFKPNIIIIGYVCVDHNIIIIILGTFRLRPEYSVILVPFLRVVHISPTIIQIIPVGRLILRLSEEYSVSICVLITTSPTIYFSIKMRSMAETYGYLLPLVRTTRLHTPV